MKKRWVNLVGAVLLTAGASVLNTASAENVFVCREEFPGRDDCYIAEEHAFAHPQPPGTFIWICHDGWNREHCHRAEPGYWDDRYYYYHHHHRHHRPYYKHRDEVIIHY